MGALWASVTAWSLGTELKRIVSSVGSRHISRSQQERLAALEPVRIDEAAVKKDAAEKDATSKAPTIWGRTPTPTQKARWKAAPTQGAVPAGRRPGTRHRSRYRSQIRLRREPPTKKLSAPERAKLSGLRNPQPLAK